MSQTSRPQTRVLTLYMVRKILPSVTASMSRVLGPFAKISRKVLRKVFAMLFSKRARTGNR